LQHSLLESSADELIEVFKGYRLIVRVLRQDILVNELTITQKRFTCYRMLVVLLAAKAFRLLDGKGT